MKFYNSFITKDYLISILLLVFSMLLLYNKSGEIFFGSPAIILSVVFFTLNIGFISKDRVLLLSILFMLMLIVISPNQSYREFFRLVFLIGSFNLIYFLKGNSKHFFLPFALFFTIELFLRILNADLSNISLYSIKGSSGFFYDSNFVGFFLATCFIGIFESGSQRFNIKSLWIVVLLLLTFSRTAWIMAISYVLTKSNRLLGGLLLLLSIAIPVFVVLQHLSLSNIDGSLQTKIVILKVFMYILQSSPLDLFFGIGRGASQAICSKIGEVNCYEGHTIFGQIVQYGLFQVTIFMAVWIHLLRRVTVSPFPFIFSIAISGVLGLYPSSYLGLLICIYGVFLGSNPLPLPKK